MELLATILHGVGDVRAEESANIRESAVGACGVTAELNLVRRDYLHSEGERSGLPAWHVRVT